MNSVFSIYQQRRIKFVKIWEYGPWKFKVYQISTKPTETIREDLILATFKAAESVIREIDLSTEHYYTGFIGIHEGTSGFFVFVDWWANKKELHHHGFYSELITPTELRPNSKSDALGCIWDVKLIAFETEVWVHSMMVPSGSVAQYLEERLNEE